MRTLQVSPNMGYSIELALQQCPHNCSRDTE